MNVQEVMQQLHSLATERTKKIYVSNGAKEPVFGVATGAMKPLFKQIKRNQPVAEQLYATGNYDAMYFAGMIAEPQAMTMDDFERWIEAAYFYMLSDYVVAVTLAESPIAEKVATRWITTGDELRMSAGWSCYCWLLGNQKDDFFDEAVLRSMLQRVRDTIHSQPERAQIAMMQFVKAVAISYAPLHEEATQLALHLGDVVVEREGKKQLILNAYPEIEKAIEKGRIGFKRKHVRC